MNELNCFQIIKPFLNERIRKSITFHSDLDSLHQSVDPKILPKEFGGEQVLFNLGSMKRQSPIFFMCSANWIPKSLILRINVTLVTQKIDPEICLRVFSISAFFSILCRILNKGGCYYLYLEDITTMKRAISKNDG